MIGSVFGRLTVIARAKSGARNRSRWTCQCQCGATVVVGHSNLTSGNSTACGGCRDKHGHTKGGKSSKTYRAYQDMITRCTKPNSRSYQSYGGRGITVCDRWIGRNGFFAFLEDMGEAPDGFSIERRDVNKGYAPENCHWIPLADQSANLQRTVIATLFGIAAPQAVWARSIGIHKATVRSRKARGMTDAEAFGVSDLAIAWG